MRMSSAVSMVIRSTRRREVVPTARCSRGLRTVRYWSVLVDDRDERAPITYFKGILLMRIFLSTRRLDRRWKYNGVRNAQKRQIIYHGSARGGVHDIAPKD